MSNIFDHVVLQLQQQTVAHERKGILISKYPKHLTDYYLPPTRKKLLCSFCFCSGNLQLWVVFTI
ncbi:hypothetical protein Hanom_Chr17g01532261 [Helianthus anomalus]